MVAYTQKLGHCMLKLKLHVNKVAKYSAQSALCVCAARYGVASQQLLAKNSILDPRARDLRRHATHRQSPESEHTKFAVFTFHLSAANRARGHIEITSTTPFLGSHSITHKHTSSTLMAPPRTDGQHIIHIKHRRYSCTIILIGLVFGSSTKKCSESWTKNTCTHTTSYPKYIGG